MRKILFGLLALAGTIFCVPDAVHAETVTQKEAKQYAKEFYRVLTNQYLNQPDYVYNGKSLTTDRLFTPFYVFNYPAGGYVIIAGDNKALPVLAYSNEGRFDDKKISEETMERLAEYAKDIEYIRYDSRIPFDAIEAWQDFSDFSRALVAASPDGSISQYERIGDGQALYRVYATEYDDLRAPQSQTEEEEYVPFSLYDSFVAETRAAEAAKEKSLEEELRPSTPVLKVHGSGRYSIDIPGQPVLARVYNLSGALVRQHKYVKNPTAYIDIVGEPSGFYFVEVVDAEGNHYGLKLIR